MNSVEVLMFVGLEVIFHGKWKIWLCLRVGEALCLEYKQDLVGLYCGRTSFQGLYDRLVVEYGWKESQTFKINSEDSQSLKSSFWFCGVLDNGLWEHSKEMYSVRRELNLWVLQTVCFMALYFCSCSGAAVPHCKRHLSLDVKLLCPKCFYFICSSVNDFLLK